ncbi:hypothetical protein CERSUDRAFT_42934 [Gelatoporia subvermispora B]|uniref:DUF6589 domain-containing protein n=1 Tax=Ceriporiopsis subvermispora (strain B) TaxID=914234 RepID=M2PWP2_CERS8|nr:hypothetical protein CERSUDRAFT_42934 [Gelatoporia subvermispora B]
MSQKWAYDGIQALSIRSKQAMISDTHSFLYLGTYDNLNIKKLVFEQRLDHQTTFDSGTAATIIIIKDSETLVPDPEARRQQRLTGSQNSITLQEIVELEQVSAPYLKTWAIFYMLNALRNAPDFQFEDYMHKDSDVFNAPSPVMQLSTGPESATCQYVLDTMHIDEASYEGNDRVFKDIWHQLGLDTPEKQQHLGHDCVIPWVGDQLTVSRIRGLQVFRCQDLNAFDRLEHLETQPGWLHLQMALENSLHTQYFGTRAGLGLIHAAELLNRKGVHTPSVQGTFHHTIQELLEHVAEARFRDLWCTVSGVPSLADLRSKTPTQLHEIAVYIVN